MSFAFCSLSRASTLTTPVQEDHPRLSICPRPAPHPVSPTQTHPSWITRDALKMLPFPVPLGTPQSMEVLISVCFPVFSASSRTVYSAKILVYLCIYHSLYVSLYFILNKKKTFMFIFFRCVLLSLFCFFSYSLRTFTNFLPVSLLGNTLVLFLFKFTPVRLRMTCH